MLCFVFHSEWFFFFLRHITHGTFFLIRVQLYFPFFFLCTFLWTVAIVYSKKCVFLKVSHENVCAPPRVAEWQKPANVITIEALFTLSDLGCVFNSLLYFACTCTCVYYDYYSNKSVNKRITVILSLFFFLVTPFAWAVKWLLRPSASGKLQVIHRWAGWRHSGSGQRGTEVLTSRCSVKCGHRIILSESRDPAGRCALTVSVSVFLPVSDVTVSCFRDGCLPCGGVTDARALGDHTAVSFWKLQVCLAPPQR